MLQRDGLSLYGSDDTFANGRLHTWHETLATTFICSTGPNPPLTEFKMGKWNIFFLAQKREHAAFSYIYTYGLVTCAARLHMQGSFCTTVPHLIDVMKFVYVLLAFCNFLAASKSKYFSWTVSSIFSFKLTRASCKSGRLCIMQMSPYSHPSMPAAKFCPDNRLSELIFRKKKGMADFA